MSDGLQRRASTPGATRSFVHGVNVTTAHVGRRLADPAVHVPLLIATGVVGVFTDVFAIGYSTMGTEIGTGLLAPVALYGVGKGIHAFVKVGRRDIERKALNGSSLNE